MSDILVTGGGGFLGQHLVAALVRRGHSVRSFGRSHPEATPAGWEGVEIQRGDIRDTDAVTRAFEGVRIAFHLVSNFRRAASDGEASAINVTGTENVLAAAQRQGIDRLVHCSTIGVHGSVLRIPADEETDFNPGDSYQRTKLVAEQRAWDVHRQSGLPVAVVRPISLFGPGDRRMLKLFKLIKRGRFLLIGDGSPLFQPAYVDDVVRGFLLCMEHPAAVGEAFIIGGDEYLPLRELLALIAEELGVSPPRLRLPMAPMLLLADLCERVFSPLGIEPPLHRRRLSFFQNNRAFSVEKARRLLGYKPQVTLRDGLVRTLRWYEANGWL